MGFYGRRDYLANLIFYDVIDWISHQYIRDVRYRFYAVTPYSSLEPMKRRKELVLYRA